MYKKKDKFVSVQKVTGDRKHEKHNFSNKRLVIIFILTSLRQLNNKLN